MKQVICFADSPHLRYATVQVGATTYLLAMSPEAIELYCPAWDDPAAYWKQTSKNVDRVRRTFAQGDFKALEIILGLVHNKAPSPSDLVLTSTKDLMMISLKLMLTRMLIVWAAEYLSDLKVQIESGDAAGISSLAILGWPGVMQLSVEFRIRDFFAFACRHFVRHCKLTNLTGAPGNYHGVVSWEGRELSLNTPDLFTRSKSRSAHACLLGKLSNKTL